MIRWIYIDSCVLGVKKEAFLRLCECEKGIYMYEIRKENSFDIYINHEFWFV